MLKQQLKNPLTAVMLSMSFMSPVAMADMKKRKRKLNTPVV